jgi:septal ring factor EnvC (AmiA/AmiB activator)
MATDRLETAVRNFQHVNQMVERYTRLCRAYVTLAERFHQLDVDHMTLKGQMVPLLKALKAHQAKLKAVEAEKTELQVTLQQQQVQQQVQIQTMLDQQEAQHRQELQQLTQTYEAKLQALASHVAELQPLEQLLNTETNHELSVAEEQIELVETTLQEMEQDSSPDLSGEEKALLAAYQSDPQAFLVAAAPLGSAVETEEPVASLWHYYYDEKIPEGCEA